MWVGPVAKCPAARVARVNASPSRVDGCPGCRHGGGVTATGADVLVCGRGPAESGSRIATALADSGFAPRTVAREVAELIEQIADPHRAGEREPPLAKHRLADMLDRGSFRSLRRCRSCHDRHHSRCNRLHARPLHIARGIARGQRGISSPRRPTTQNMAGSCSSAKPATTFVAAPVKSSVPKSLRA